MKRPRRILSGILLMIYASVAFSLMALCIKSISRFMPSQEIVFLRSLTGFMITFSVVYGKRVPVFGNSWQPLVWRGLIGFVSLALYIYTIAHLPLGTAVLLNYTSPVFSALMAIVFLKERPNALLLGMTILAFAGIYLLIARPAELSQQFAVWIGLLSAITTAVAYISIRSIKNRESPLIIILYFTVISTLGSLFFIRQEFVWPRGLSVWLAIIGIGIFSFYGQLWMTIALRRIPVSLAVPFSYITPLLSFCYGFLFWKEHLNGKEMIGIAMVITAGSLISWLGHTQET